MATAPSDAAEATPFSLTVLTPTYDRASRLPALYESLLRQADPRVEWLIVDDGSRDDTAAVVAAWIAEGRLPIRYIAKPNGGKHTALNVGIPTITSRLTFIVDSDDWLTDDAVRLIEAYDDKYRARPGLAGFSFLRVAPDGSSLLSRGGLPAAEFVESYIDCRLNGDLDGDMAEVFYTERLQAFPFPEFPGERFIAEDVVWIRMALTDDLVFIDTPIYVCEYLPGGLTRTGRSMAIRAPLGAMERARLLMVDRCAWRVRLKGAVLYGCYSRFAGLDARTAIHTSGHPWLSLLGYPFGLVLHRGWRRNG